MNKYIRHNIAFWELIITVLSMTGFGRAKLSEQDFDITVEIKSVNHRYFEYSCRIPRAFSFMEEKLKTLLKSKISRGKVEISVFVEDTSDNSIVLEINKTYTDAYVKALHTLAKEYKLKDDIKASALVGNSDIFSSKHRDVEDEVIEDLITRTASEALDAFINSRQAEGERLKADVISRADYILSQVAVIEERSPETIAEYRKRLEDKIKELLGDNTVDEQRILTETAIFADKIAVNEETVRLRSHIEALKELFESGDAIGRKLDFTVQEMNRETNTIGSKAQDLQIARIVVDIKSEIEKIREQIQNIE